MVKSFIHTFSFIAIFLVPTLIFCQCSNNEDYKALRALYLSTDGDNWINKTGWPDKTFFLNNPNITPNLNLSTWWGITCNDNNVTRIELRLNNLSGTLPNLQMENLTVLSLNGNKLSGFSTNFNFPKLVFLNLQSNSFTGDIPNFNLVSLKSLNLGYNQFKGNIPDFNLPNIEFLDLIGNDLEGCIPSSFKKYCTKAIVQLFDNNRLPWGGDFERYCSTDGSIESQIGKRCGSCFSHDLFKGVVDENCKCIQSVKVIVDGFCFFDEIRDTIYDPENEKAAQNVLIAAYPKCDFNSTPIITRTNEYGYYSMQLDSLVDYVILPYNGVDSTFYPSSFCDGLNGYVGCIDLSFGCGYHYDIPLQSKSFCAKDSLWVDNSCNDASSKTIFDLTPFKNKICNNNPCSINQEANGVVCVFLTNSSFLSFVAGYGKYTINLEISECLELLETEFNGLQYGLFESCNFNEPVILCESNPQVKGKIISIDSHLFIPGKTYILWVDGYLVVDSTKIVSSVCSYQTYLSGDYMKFSPPQVKEILVETECSSLCPNMKEVKLNAVLDTNYVNSKNPFVEMNYLWDISGPKGIEKFYFKSVKSTHLNYSFSLPGNYKICLNTFHECCSDTMTYCQNIYVNNLPNQQKIIKLRPTDFPWDGALEESGVPMLDAFGNQWKWDQGQITLDKLSKKGASKFSSKYYDKCGCTYTQQLIISLENLSIDENEDLEIDSSYIMQNSNSFWKYEDKLKTNKEIRIQNNHYHIYPNPISQYVQILFYDFEDFKIEVFNINGQMISNQLTKNKLSDNKIWMDFSALENGIYIIHIFNNHQHYYDKVIKM